MFLRAFSLSFFFSNRFFFVGNFPQLFFSFGPENIWRFDVFLRFGDRGLLFWKKGGLERDSGCLFDRNSDLFVTVLFGLPVKRIDSLG